MSTAIMEGSTQTSIALAGAHLAVDDLLAAPLTRGSDAELLDDLRELERLRRRVDAVEHRLILEAETRSLPDTHSCRTTGLFLRRLLKIDPAEAHARVRAAEAAGERCALTGEALPAAYPVVAEAQRIGGISARHAAIVVDTIEKLPDEARHENGAEVEELLVGYAHRFDPRQLAKLAARTRDWLDPDGALDKEKLRQRLRELTIHVRADGSSKVSGELTSEATELLLLHLDALAAPQPESNGVKDPRTAGQRRHDALVEMMKLVVRSGLLPTVSGVTATVVVTMTEEQYRTGCGLARTAHGALVPVPEVFRWAGGDYRLLAVVMDKVKGITAYSSTQRLFSENQRLAMWARDGGCTFPHCHAPPWQCELHHLRDWADGGPTSVDNGAFVCGFDHQQRIAEGWRAELIEGRVGWVPPAWIDPERRPQFNDVHRPELDT
jgi:Domain of unknown function (DUF222)